MAADCSDLWQLACAILALTRALGLVCQYFKLLKLLGCTNLISWWFLHVLDGKAPLLDALECDLVLRLIASGIGGIGSHVDGITFHVNGCGITATGSL